VLLFLRSEGTGTPDRLIISLSHILFHFIQCHVTFFYLNITASNDVNIHLEPDLVDGGLWYICMTLMGHLPPTLGYKHRVLSQTITDGGQVYLTGDQQRQGD
jgi:hypothetical protein